MSFSLLLDEPDPLAELGVCGLRNIGNTCYMNASLQCLRSLPSLMTHCLSSGPAQPLKKEKEGEEEPTTLDKSVACRSHIYTTFTSLVKKLWSGQFSDVRPRLLKTTLGLLHPQFSGSRQVRRLVVAYKTQILYLDLYSTTLKNSWPCCWIFSMSIAPLTIPQCSPIPSRVIYGTR